MNQCNTVFFDLWQRVRRSFFLASQKYFSFQKFPHAVPAIFAVALTVAACSGGGGGGGGGDGSSGSSSSNFVVSGAVSAPNGAVAFLPRKNLLEQFADAFIAPVHAAISGFLSVAEGTKVELVRINNDGTAVSVLAATTTSGGRYSFDLTALGIGTASDLVVQVLDPSGIVRMRAFVASAIVDIDPVSETAARIVLEQAVTSSLGNFTTQELADIYSALYLFVMTQALPVGADIESTVSAFRNAVLADSNIAGFISATAEAGQTEQGPGDIGNYFPFEDGVSWEYRVAVQIDGQPPINYNNTVQINGTHDTGSGVMATVFHETNPSNSGIAEDDYLVKDGRAITNYGSNDVTDFLTPQLVPYQEYLFPLRIGASFVAFNKRSLDLGEDWGNDGINEKVNINATVTVSEFEDVTVPAGSYVNCAKITAVVTFVVTFSDDGSMYRQTSTVTEWYAPGTGAVKRMTIHQVPEAGYSETHTTELISSVRPFGLSAINVGSGFTCGLTASGNAYCWGANQNGVLGNGTTSASTVPVGVSGDHAFISLSPGARGHVCGVQTDDAAYCWGENLWGQLGITTATTYSAIPSAVPGGMTFESVTAGEEHSCGVTTNGTGYCWGLNLAGRLGDGTASDTIMPPVQIVGGLIFSSLSAGRYHTCGVTANGVAYCWGDNPWGQLGNGTTTGSTTPVPVAGELVFSSLSAGMHNTCGVTTGGAAYCWGGNLWGQLGNGTTTGNALPVPVSGDLVFSSLSAGTYNTCGVTTNGVAHCWGMNSFGQLGIGAASDNVTTPVPVANGYTFTSVSIKDYHACGIVTGGRAYCWGMNLSGQLGNGTTDNSYVPRLVTIPQ